MGLFRWPYLVLKSLTSVGRICVDTFWRMILSLAALCRSQAPLSELHDPPTAPADALLERLKVLDRLVEQTDQPQSVQAKWLAQNSSCILRMAERLKPRTVAVPCAPRKIGTFEMIVSAWSKGWRGNFGFLPSSPDMLRLPK